jgi:hypothetical protein
MRVLAVMFRINLIVFILSFTTFIGATSVKANCLMFGENERLSNYCLLESIKGKLIDQSTANIVVHKLTQEGYLGGLNKPATTFNFYPDIAYSNNINGGNPDKPLIIGNLKFEGEPNLVAKKGAVLSLNLRSSARKTYGVGRYINAFVSGAFLISPEHSLSYTNARLGICSKNRITGSIYFDACAVEGTQKKEITKTTDKSTTASLSRLSTVAGLGFVEEKIGVTHLVKDDYSQNQLFISLDTIHKENLYSSITLKFGEALHEQLTMEHEINLAISTIFNGRKYSLGLAHEQSGGGMLLGVGLSEKTYKASIATSLSANTQINVGLTKVESSIDYFDQTYPSLTLTHNW